ncbi:leukocyte elastase inhibitor-like isoform X2 [Penaeus chinensis]|uniref:leukocyte elastase inhibitor-like isoform X2 n=1 Tax=Penaeus chinensis TaxID=139456 RepID=UPI001FB7AD4C|nr:leukocyte elastase inhibitor-like isoform X2 [Penaeus chinensis]
MENTFAPFPNHRDVLKLSLSQRNFARDMYLKLARSSPGNIFFSPFTIMTALGMVYSGAQRNTEQEMKTVMNLSQDRISLHRAFKDVITDFQKKGGPFELCTSNIAYVPDNVPLLPNYKAILSNTYQSYAKSGNFRKPELVREEINDTVKSQTNSRILEVMPEGVIDEDLKILLVNIVYFKGLWEKEFVSHTTEGIFWLSEEENIKVPMMHISESFDMVHHKDLGATVLSMDYKGSRLSMLIVLPLERDGLSEIEAKMADMDLGDLEKAMCSCKIAVSLPRFKMLETIHLTDLLIEMGMKDLFSEKSSDLSGITGNRQLFISQVIHKYFLEVNETGTEAAAATCTPTLCTSYVLLIKKPRPPNFIADHPFMFFIRDQLSGLVLFIGRLTNPTA